MQQVTERPRWCSECGLPARYVEPSNSTDAGYYHSATLTEVISRSHALGLKPTHRVYIRRELQVA